MNRVIISLFCPLLLITGCTAPQSRSATKNIGNEAIEAAAQDRAQKCQSVGEEVRKGSLGEMPPFSEDMIKKGFEMKLNDPFSAHYKIGKPRRCVLDCLDGKPSGAWAVLVLVNAKNKFGAYVGWHPYVFTWLKERQEWNKEMFDFRVFLSAKLNNQNEDQARSVLMDSILWVDPE